MFRTLICPSSGAYDYSVELPHWSYCSWFDMCWSFGVVWLEWYPCCRLKHNFNMFRTLIHPSSGACDYSVELPHWSYCSRFDMCWSFGVVWLEWYPCCRLKHNFNMFRTLIYPSSGACDYSVELPHWSYWSWFDVCWSFSVVWLEWYLCCRLKHNFNMFRTLIYPSSGACDYSVELAHWSYCSWFDVCWSFGVADWGGIRVAGSCASACNTDTTPTQPHRNYNTHRTKNNSTNAVIQQNSRKLLMMDVLMSETCWAHKKWNKITSDINLVFYSSTITMMHSPININFIDTVQVCNTDQTISIVSTTS